MMMLRVGQGDVEFVIDTGSSQLSAKGTGCVWQNCITNTTSETCTTVACPCGLERNGLARVDCRAHYYIPTGTALKPGEGGAGTATTLVYGSQQDTISHYTETITVSSTPVSDDELMNELPTRNPLPTQQTPVNHTLGSIVVHRVSKIKGSSSSNLLGLSKPSNTISTESGDVVLQKLFGGSDSQWNLILRPDAGWWTLGPAPSCFTNIKYVPLVNPSDFNNFVTKFYVVPIRRIAVGNSHRMRNLSRSHTPRYLLIDTGTTLTYGSTRLGSAMRGAGWIETSSYVEIEIGTSDHHVTITYSPIQLQDTDNPSLSILQVEPERTLDDFDDIFPLNSCILFGVLMMQNMIWAFDLANNRIGVGKLDQ